MVVGSGLKLMYFSFSEYYQQLCQEASRRWDSQLIELLKSTSILFSLSDQLISGLESVPELAQKARADYLEKLMQSNIEAAVAFGTYILGLASIVNTKICLHLYTGLSSDCWTASGAGFILSLQHCRLLDIRHRVHLRTLCWLQERLGRLHHRVTSGMEIPQYSFCIV